MKDQTKRILFFSLVILLVQLFAIAALGAALPRDNSNWKNLNQLAPGDGIIIVLNNMNSYKGIFKKLSDDAIVVQAGKKEQTLSRQDVFRVSRKVGQNHEVRNMLIGAVVGAGAGLVIGLGPYYVRRNCTEGPEFNCGYPPNSHWVKVLTPVGGLAGVAIGAAVPTGGWHDVYRAR